MARRVLEEIGLMLTRVRVDRDSGIVLVDTTAPAWYVRRIRAWNFIEPVGIFGIILLIVWTSMLDPNVLWWKASFGVLFVWLLLLSPFVHYRYEKNLFLTPAQQRLGVWFYFFECRGMGSPLRYYLPVDGQPPYIKKYWKTILGVTMFINLLFLCALIAFNKEIIERFHLEGMTPMQGVLFRLGKVLTYDAGLIFIGYPFMLRLDNFHKSLKFMGLFAVGIVIMAVGANLLFQIDEPAVREFFKDSRDMRLRGPTAAERLHALTLFQVGGQWAGYVFWGFLQQLLFLGVFSTQLCRAFDIGRSRFQLLLSCLCSAALFGLIHIPNFWLSVITWIGGFLGALVAVQCRNLFALGVVHGLGGTLFNKLLPINFSVGPSQVK